MGGGGVRPAEIISGDGGGTMDNVAQNKQPTQTESSVTPKTPSAPLLRARTNLLQGQPGAGRAIKPQPHPSKDLGKDETLISQTTFGRYKLVAAPGFLQVGCRSGGNFYVWVANYLLPGMKYSKYRVPKVWPLGGPGTGTPRPHVEHNKIHTGETVNSIQ